MTAVHDSAAPGASSGFGAGLLARLAKPVLFIVTVLLLFETAQFTTRQAWPMEDNARYACYFVLALFSASLKVRGRELAGATSMSFVFVIIGLVELSLAETLLIGGSAILIQAVAKKMTQQRSEETLATLLSTLSAAVASQWLYRSDALRQFGMEAPVRLVLAVVGSFVAYNLPAGLAGLIADGFNRKRLTERMYLWSFPYHLVAATVTALYSFIFPFVRWYAAAFLLPLVYLIYRVFDLYVNRLEKQRMHATAMSDLHLRTIETLALAIEAKDHTTHDHLRRVQAYAMELGRELGLNGSELHALRAAAVLHDIGKLAVPEHIVSKPGKLTPEEFEKMKIHPVVGAEILERARFPYPVVPIVRAHHEKWDGSGYPDGLKEEAIPIGARILAAVDCLDALASDRQYRRALPIDRAMDEVAARSGKDFDPRVIAVLSRRYRELEQMAKNATPIKPLFEHSEPDRAPAAGGPMEENSALPPPPFLRTIGAAREEVQKLFDLAQQLGSSLELRDIFGVLSRGLQPLVPYGAMALFLDSGDHLTPEFLHGRDAGVCSSLSVAKGAGITGWVVSNSKAAVNCDPAREGPSMGAFGCMLSIPLTGRHGVVGALSLYSRKRQSYGADHLRLVNAIASKLSLAVENGITFRRAESSATTDYLTGLPNAHSLFVHLDREVEVSRYLSSPLGVMVCDLNGFKSINDTRGHLTGNQLLQAVAKALQSKCAEYDYVARMGGDEFVIISSGVGRETLEQKMREMRSAIRAAGDEVCGFGLLDASFGSALFPEDAATADELLAAADRQMYQDKTRSSTGASFVRKMDKPGSPRRAKVESNVVIQ